MVAPVVETATGTATATMAVLSRMVVFLMWI